MKILRDWFSDMAYSHKGWYTLANAQFDHFENRLDKQLIRGFMIEVAKRWRRLPTKHPSDHMHAVSLSNSANYICRGELLSAKSKLCSRVMLAEDLLLHHLKKQKIIFSVSGVLTPREAYLLEHSGLKGKTKKSYMKTGRPFAWVTQTSALKRLLDSTTTVDRAGVVRNCLGLRNFEEESHIIEVRYPKAVCKSLELRAPTFIEGCPSFVYRSNVGPDRWGLSVNLADLSDGLPEAVHRPIPFGEDFTVREIGILYPPLAIPNWVSFKNTFKFPWTMHSADELDPPGGSRAKAKPRSKKSRKRVARKTK